ARRLLKLDRAMATPRRTREERGKPVSERLLFYHTFKAASYLWSAPVIAFSHSSERKAPTGPRSPNHSLPSSPGNNVTTRKTKESSVTTIVVTHAAALYSGPFT